MHAQQTRRRGRGLRVEGMGARGGRLGGSTGETMQKSQTNQATQRRCGVEQPRVTRRVTVHAGPTTVL